MSILESANKPADRPIVATILGDAGTGKTRLAATFPKPIFIRGEDGMQSIPIDERPDALPLLESSEQLWEQLKAIVTEDHDYRTLVIDSVTALEQLFAKEIVSNDPKATTLAQARGGYGAGYQAVAGMHHRVLKAATLCNVRKNMAVIFVAHADTDRIEPPDANEYTRWTIRMHRKSVPAYIDNVDMVSHIRLETFIKNDDPSKPGKAVSDGTRVLQAYSSANSVTKNRYGITADIEVPEGANPLAGLVPGAQ